MLPTPRQDVSYHLLDSSQNSRPGILTGPRCKTADDTDAARLCGVGLQFDSDSCQLSPTRRTKNLNDTYNFPLLDSEQLSNSPWHAEDGQT